MLAITFSGLDLLARTSSSSSNNGGAFGLIFLLSGFVFYGFIYLKYRNVNQRHHYESETQATKLNMQQADDLIRSLTGLRSSQMSGANNTAVTGSGGLPTSMSQLKGMTGQLTSMVTKAAQQAQAQQQAQHSNGQPAGGAAPNVPPPPAAPSAPPVPPPPAAPPTEKPGQPF